MTPGAYASVNGIDLYYEVHGADRPGIPLIMLHGGVLTFHLSFDALLPEVAADRQVIGVELQGHGHTADGERPFSIRQCAEDVVALLDELGVERADFFGFSLGGLVSTEVATGYPERVGRVVLAASHFRPDAYYPEITAPEQDSPRLPTEDDFAAMHRAYTEVAPDPDHFFAFLEKIQPAVHDFEPWTDEQLARLTMPIPDDHRGHRLRPARARGRDAEPAAGLAAGHPARNQAHRGRQAGRPGAADGQGLPTPLTTPSARRGSRHFIGSEGRAVFERHPAFTCANAVTMRATRTVWPTRGPHAGCGFCLDDLIGEVVRTFAA